jgi:hypothetical protein
MKKLSLLFSLVLLLVYAVSANAQTARLQVIHNAADPAAEVVDVYVNGGSPFIDDFAFRTATPFVDVPAGVALNIGIAPGTSSSVDDTIASFLVTLEPGKTYVAIANGVLDPAGFAPNPDGQSIGFTLFARDGIKECAPFHLVRIIAFHGATDAPTVDILWRTRWGARRLFNNLTYGEFSRYRWLFAKNFILDVTPGNDNSTVVASFEADLSGLGGGAAVVFASGFLDPTVNQDGPAFGLFAALPNGQVVALPALGNTARLQVIHNAADPAAEVVDVYVNGGSPFIDDFAFRTATPFVDVPAGVALNIGIAPGTSSSVDDTIASFVVTLEAGKTYVAIANGVLDPTDFAPNPDDLDIGFTLFARDGIRESARYPFVKLIAFHGATDAPTVDVLVRLGWWRFSLFDDLSYGSFSCYRAVLPWSYTLDVTPGNDNSTVVASFEANLFGLGGGAAVVFASGFLDPSANQGGPGFGLFAALPNGDVVELPAISPSPKMADGDELNRPSVPENYQLAQNYPNPFNPTTTIQFQLPQASQVTLKVYNALGREVETLVNGPKQAGLHQVEFDASHLASGVYFYRIKADSFESTKRMILMK